MEVWVAGASTRFGGKEAERQHQERHARAYDTPEASALFSRHNQFHPGHHPCGTVESISARRCQRKARRSCREIRCVWLGWLFIALYNAQY